MTACLFTGKHDHEVCIAQEQRHEREVSGASFESQALTAIMSAMGGRTISPSGVEMAKAIAYWATLNEYDWVGVKTSMLQLAVWLNQVAEKNCDDKCEPVCVGHT